jgi:hypothetical protein
MTRVYKPLVSAPMQSNNFLDTDKKSQLYMGQILSAILLPTPGSLNNSHLLQVFIFTFGILSIIKSKQCISNRLYHNGV